MQTILIVDDEDFVLKVTEGLIESLGYFVITTASGVEAIKLARDYQPALILTDYFIPDFGGAELIERLISLEHTPKVIAMSSGSFRAHLTQNDPTQHSNPTLLKAQNAGAHAIVHKPVQKEQLETLLRQLLSD